MLMMCSELDVDARRQSAMYSEVTFGSSLCGIPRSVEQWSVLKNNVCIYSMHGAAANP